MTSSAEEPRFTPAQDEVVQGLRRMLARIEAKAAALPPRPADRRRLLRTRRALARWILGGRP